MEGSCCTSSDCAGEISAPLRRLSVPAMCCGHEAAQIRQALQQLPGIANLRFDIPGRSVSMQADETAWDAALSAVNTLGFETSPPAQGHDARACCGSDHHQHAAPITAPLPMVTAGAFLLRIPEMDCPVEEAQIRQTLETFPEIRQLHFDLPARTLAIDAPADSWDRLVAAIGQQGFTPTQVSAPPATADTAKSQRSQLRRLLTALTVAAIAELWHLSFPDTPSWRMAGMAVAALAIALSGFAVLKKGLSALLRGQLNIGALMSVAVIGAFVIGQWPEAAMVMSLYALAELIEARAVERARNAIASLLALSPARTEVRQADNSWAPMDAQAVAVGAIARVKPGERFALDGRIRTGHGTVDEAPVTGESLPVEKGPGDEVFAGTINQGDALEFEVTKPAADTVLARIIRAVEQAQSQRAPTQRFVDKFAAVYTPTVFLLASAVALGFPLLAGWPWLEAIYKALVLLVIACPCALVISTPITIVSGLATAARRGILLKGGSHLEQARKLTTLCLDKTGTLTAGRPELVAHQALRDAPGALQIARSLAARSDHPVSKAIAAGLAALDNTPAQPVHDFAAEQGRGVRGSVDGHAYILGNQRWLQERGQCSTELEAQLTAHETQGRTLSVLADERGPLALFAVADTLRESSRQAVAELTALGVRTVMLTGDNATTARAIATQLAISEVHAGLLPEDKLNVITELQAAGEQVGMVGDGINDSPSLAAAQLGFAMGGAGTDTAKEAADVLIMNDDLRKLPETLRLSAKTHAVLWQNITIALGIKLLFFALALFGSATMWMAVFADMGASLLVVFNGLRLLGGAHR